MTPYETMKLLRSASVREKFAKDLIQEVRDKNIRYDEAVPFIHAIDEIDNAVFICVLTCL